MAKYVAYNRFYVRGKPTGRPYKVAEGKTRAEVTAIANKYNSRWNKMASSRRDKVAGHLASVKQVGLKRKATRRTSGFGSMYRLW